MKTARNRARSSKRGRTRAWRIEFLEDRFALDERSTLDAETEEMQSSSPLAGSMLTPSTTPRLRSIGQRNV